MQKIDCQFIWLGFFGVFVEFCVVFVGVFVVCLFKNTAVLATF